MDYAWTYAIKLDIQVKRLLTVVVLCLPLLAAAKDDSLLYVPSNQLSAYWTVVRPAKPKYPRGPDYQTKEACVTVGYIIESDGQTSTQRVIATYPNARFGESVLHAIRKSKYKPADSNPERIPVFTTTLFTFNVRRGEETNEQVRDALTKICTSAAQTILDQEAGDGQEPGHGR